MKILLISNMYPSLSHPSYGVFVRNFENTLLQSGAIVRNAVIKGRGRNIAEKLTKYLAFFRDVYRELIKNDFDLLYIHYVSYSLLPIVPFLRFIRRPIVVNAHGNDILPEGRVAGVIFRLTRSAVRGSKMIVVPSNYFKSIAFEKYGHPNIFVSPSGGIDLGIFFPDSQDKSLTSPIRIGCASRIDKGKGWDVFLRALKRIGASNSELVFEGILVHTGAEVDKMKRMIVDLGLEKRVTYLGEQTQRELSNIYRSLDLLVFPTLLDESLGLVGLEAMACGVPVVGSNIGGLNDYIVDGENGYSFEPGNYEELCEKIMLFIGLSNDARKLIRQRAIEKANEFESVGVAAKLTQKLEELAATY